MVISQDCRTAHWLDKLVHSWELLSVRLLDPLESLREHCLGALTVPM